MEFIPRQRQSRLADIIAQFAQQNPIADGVARAGGSIGRMLESRNAAAASADSGRQNNILDLLKTGQLEGHTGTVVNGQRVMDPASPGSIPLREAFGDQGYPAGMSYKPAQDKNTIKITPEIIANYPSIAKMGYQAGDAVPATVFNAQTKAPMGDRTRVEVTPELAKKYKGLIVGSMVPSTYMASLEQNAKEAETRAGDKKEGKILPASNVLALNEGKTVARLLPEVETALKEAESVMGPFEGRAGAINPYNTKTQTLDARFRTASQSFGRFMEGGVLRKEDEEKYRKMFPQLSDTPQVAKNKLDIVRRQLAQKYEDDRVTMGKSGYDVSGFEALEIPPSIFGKPAPKPSPGGPPAFTPEMAARKAEIQARLAAINAGNQ